MTRFISSVLVAGLIWTGCSRPVQPPAFQSERALEYIRQQVAFGPRVSGSEASARCRDWLYTHFRTQGLAVDSQKFQQLDPYTSVDTPMVNVIARYRGNPSDSKAILLAAHYDSRPRTDYHSDSTKRNQPLDGANDGGSGVAVLMEMANMFARQGPNCNVDLVLVDGEDWGKSGDADYYSLGAKEFARQGIRERYHFAIVIDMIGDAFQQIYREDYTERFYKPINDMIWTTAARLGVKTFVDGIRHTVIDDHIPLGAAGVPTALLIDFDYKYWHTEKDTPDKCSAESLGNVGQVLAYIVYNETVWPKN